MIEEEIEKALQINNLCRIAFIDGEYPYIAPFQFVYHNNQIYFHFTNYGKKIKLIKKSKNVCVSIENFEADLEEYYFISMQGELAPVDNMEEKESIILKMAEEAKDKYSQNFLTAHGFDKKKGWDAFKLQNQLIFTLIQKRKIIGLKSG